jgi:hypothetical protein
LSVNSSSFVFGVIMSTRITSCIFCGRTDLSEEHIWPKWAHPTLRKSPSSGAYIQKKWKTSPKNPRIRGETFHRERPTDVFQISLKVVCKRHCNNGWMSRLETSAKPVALPLIAGTHAVLEKYRQEILATWLAMKLMTCEFSDPEDLATPELERALLMGRRRPPDIMGIWIARCADLGWSNTYWRQAATLGWAPIGTLPPQPVSLLPKNTQAQTFVIGELFVQAVSTTVAGLKFHTPPAIGRSMRQIWPFERAFLWPPGPSLSDNDVRFITRAFDRFTSQLPFSPGR